MIKKNYLKRAAAVAMAMSMVLPQTGVYAGDMQAQSDVIQASAINTYDDDFLRSLPTPATGYREVENGNIQAPGIVNSDVSEASELGYARSTSYPAYYKTANLPAVRDQNPYGACWAFSTISLLEINLIRKGLVSSDIDLSELHLINFTYDCQLDPLGGNEGDANSFKTDQGSVMELGGSVDLAVNSLMDWEGAVDESVLPCTSDNVAKVNGRKVDGSLAYSNTKAHLESYYKINTSSRTDIKQAVTDYGAVSISYYTDSSFASSDYYNSQKSAYYCPDKQQHNHAVTIVGWDDNFSADNFAQKPEGNGAWIVRNSWGDYYGEGGYFYLSYYDATITGTGYAFEAGLSDNYDNNYQYDGALWYNYFPFASQTNTYANIFTAKANDGNKESIEAVSFETYQAANAGYKVQIYKNLDSMSRPQSGTLVAEKSGTLTFEGAYTIKLDEAVEINNGDTFSVVVELTGATQDQYPYIICDTNYSDGWFISKSSAKENQSFLLYPNEDFWIDCGQQYSGNFRIKAYTNNKNDNVVNVEAVSLDKKEATLNKNQTLQLKATVTPSNANNQNVTFTSSNEKVAKVNSEGLVTAVSAGTAVITVKTKDGSKTAQCNITVKEEETTKATEAPTESTTKATEATTKATESTTKATEATTKATESTTKATEATTKETEATTKATEPTTEVTKPEETTKPTEATKPEEKLNGIVDGGYGNWYYYVDGKVDRNYNGLAQNENGWWKITRGVVDFGCNDVVEFNGNWWKITNGQVDFGYNSLAENEYGWWKIAEGKVDFESNDVVEFNGNWWKITNGQVDFGYNSLAENEYGWWKIVDGKVDFESNDVVEFNGNWWKITNGQVDFGYNDLAENEYGWWKIAGGQVDFDCNTLVEFNNGWWKVEAGKVNFESNTVCEFNGAWWKITNGQVDFGYNSLAENEYGWWKIVDGRVDFESNDVVEFNGNWWKTTNGQVDFGYNSLAQNQYGWWKITNGMVDFNYNGYETYEGVEYHVTNGHVD